MIEIILNSDVDKRKIDALLQFLKSWDIDARLKRTPSVKPKQEVKFTLSTGIWKDYDIDGKKLRQQTRTRYQ